MPKLETKLLNFSLYKFFIQTTILIHFQKKKSLTKKLHSKTRTFQFSSTRTSKSYTSNDHNRSTDQQQEETKLQYHDDPRDRNRPNLTHGFETKG